jgi:hypothetical protein
MITATRQWAARGGPLLLGKLIPGACACAGLACVAASIANVADKGWRSSAGSGFLLATALVATYVAVQIFRTTWLVSLTDGTFTWVATTRRWLVGPGDIIAVRAGAYDQIIQIVTMRRKILVWAQLDDRQALFEAIELANPSVRFAPWIDATSGQ